MAAHPTTMDGGNASGLQQQSAPCAAHRLPKDGLFQQPANNGVEYATRTGAPSRFAVRRPLSLHVVSKRRSLVNELLSRSAELEAALREFLALKAFDGSTRRVSCRILCSVALEHAESAKLLIVSGNFTSAAGLLRLQYEALVRAMWLLYAASDVAVEKLAADLTHESEKKAERIPMLAEMLSELEGKAPTEAIGMLLEFKQYSWKPSSSFVHGGIHAIDRHGRGYPIPLLVQALKASNGVSTMVGMLLVIVSGDPAQRGKIPEIQKKFADCLPPHREKGS